ncbi:hypothetical protein SD78_0606 [Bacillus badius]|nr:hypothetical protein SD78_0606 [Bacillus badius]
MYEAKGNKKVAFLRTKGSFFINLLVETKGWKSKRFLAHFVQNLFRGGL